MYLLSPDLLSPTLSAFADLSFFPIFTNPVYASMCVLLAFVFDSIFGEPKKYHPIVGLGNLIAVVERAFYPENNNRPRLLIRGVSAAFIVHSSVFICILLVVLALSAIIESDNVHVWFGMLSVIILYICIAPRSLIQHISSVETTLASGNVENARVALSRVVSRDTCSLEEPEIAKAAIETLTENENDGVIAPLFWFLIGGPIGAVFFKVSNILDSMWGYRNTRYNYFGRFSARVDDVLGYIPARLCALIFSISIRRFVQALRNGRNWYSPNAGPVMAAGALALGVSLGGRAVYDGSVKIRPVLGAGPEPTPLDLTRSITMIRWIHRCLMLGFSVLFLVSLVLRW